MKKILYFVAASLIVFSSCEKIDGDDRFIDNNQGSNQPSKVVKRMLVEDFTGQNCPNCPDGAAILEDLQKSTFTNGEMIVVAMHAGGLADSRFLKHETAQTYMDALNLKNNPALSVDRVSSTDVSITQWGAMITKRAGEATSPCDIETRLFYNPDTRTVNAVSDVKFVEDYNGGKLGVQHYLLRDSLVVFQSTTHGMDNAYVHNHVFFGTLYKNIWGEELVGADGGVYKAGTVCTTKVSDDFVLGNEKWGKKEPWDPNKVYVVSFVFKYSDDEANPIGEVIQATKVKLLN